MEENEDLSTRCWKCHSQSTPTPSTPEDVQASAARRRGGLPVPLRVGLSLVVGGMLVLRQSRSMAEFYQRMGDEGPSTMPTMLGYLLLVIGGIAISMGIAQYIRRNDP